jgi:hypothetical protein
MTGWLAEPGPWLRMVAGIGVVHAALAALTLAWLAVGADLADGTRQALARPHLYVLVVAAVVVPFLAYGVDSATLLERHPGDRAALWQARGGLAGLALAVIAVHGVVMLGLVRGAVQGLLVYQLVFPVFMAGAAGAAAGIAAAVLVDALAP